MTVFLCQFIHKHTKSSPPPIQRSNVSTLFLEKSTLILTFLMRSQANFTRWHENTILAKFRIETVCARRCGSLAGLLNFFHPRTK